VELTESEFQTANGLPDSEMTLRAVMIIHEEGQLLVRSSWSKKTP